MADGFVGTTQDVFIDQDISTEIFTKMAENSVILSLVNATTQPFQDVEYIFFDEEPESEVVGEGAPKSSSPWGFEPKEARRLKLQTTVRMNEEVIWANSASKVKYFDALIDSLSKSDSRGIDYTLIHAINPLSRTVLPSLKDDAIAYTANQVTATGDYLADIDNLADLILENYEVTGLALDRMYANTLRKQRNKYTGAREFSEITLSLNPGSVDGISTVTSGAVSGKRLSPTPTGIQAIMGCWDLLKLGIIENIGVKEIRYGDPDGKGDLQRYNQVAYRTELVFLTANLDPKGFSVLRSSEGDDTPGGDTPGGDTPGGDDNGGDDDENKVEPQSVKSTKATK